MVHHHPPRQRLQKTLSLMSVVLLLLMILSACGNPQVQSKASTNKSDLDKAIAHAQSIGVPDTQLRPIINQAQKISSTNEPLTIFSSQPATDYYTNLAKNYQTLIVQVRGLEDQTTQQFGFQASNDVKDFSTMLSQRQSFVEAKNFSDKLTQTQNEMNQAQTPKQFSSVSQQAKQSADALRLLGTANDKLMSFQDQIKTLKSSNLDTTALDNQASEDVRMFRAATTPDAFQSIINQLNAQSQTASTISTQAVPYLGQLKLSQFQTAIDSIQKYGGNSAQYQKQHDTDKELLDAGNFVKFSAQIDKDSEDIRLPLLQLQATHDVNQLMSDAKNWGQGHQYQDDWNGQSYVRAYDYWNGTVYDLQSDLNNGVDPNGDLLTTDGYQQIIDAAKTQKMLFNAMTADAADTTPYNVPHQSDLDLMKQFGIKSGKVIVASLNNGALRVYQDGQLVHSILIVSGMPEKPSPPGFTTVTNRQSPAVFKAFDQNKTSPFYYPDTKINYAMMYHVGEYYFHDSWWRASDDYGPGKQYPHYAPAASNEGTHGCINMSLDETTWLWNFTQSAETSTIYSIVY